MTSVLLPSAEDPLVVVSALEREVAPLRRLLATSRSARREDGGWWRLGARRMMVEVVGVGDEAARRGAERLGLEAREAGTLLIVGLAGAATESLRSGELRWVDRAVRARQRAGGLQVEPARGVDLAKPRGARGDRTLLASVDRLLLQPEQKRGLAAALPGEHHLLVDLETWTLAAIAHEAGWQVGCLRVISDEARERLPSILERGWRTDGGYSESAVARGLLTRPWQLPGLLRLARRARVGSERLAAELVEVLT